MKNKISIYLNMLIICLSLCVISIGVYSLTSANLTISGSLGYVYHDKTPYIVTATIQNYTTTEDGTLQTSATSTPLTIGEAEPDTTAGTEFTKISLTDDQIYFKGKGWDAKHIEVLVTVKNNEDTQKAVVLLFDDITGLGYTRKVVKREETTPGNITTNHSEAIILSTGEQTTFRLTLKQSIKKTNLSIAKSDFNIQVSVADYVASNFAESQTDTNTTTGITYTLNTDLKSWSVTNSSVSGDVTFEPIAQGLPANTINGLKVKSGTLTIPNSVTDIATSIADEYGQIYCSAPGSITNLCSYAFVRSGAQNLQGFVGNCIFNFEVIGKKAFWMTKFEEIELQSDELTRIEEQTFFNNGLLKTIILPQNLSKIESAGIGGTVNIESIFFTGITPPTFADEGITRLSSNYVIYVPAESISAYQTALEDIIDDTSIIQAIP